MKRVRLAPFDLPLLVFWASALMGVFILFDRASAQRTLVALTGITLLYFFISRAVKSGQRWDGFATLLAGLSTLAALYFITQAGHIAYDEKIGLIDRVTRWIAAVVPSFPIWKPVPNSLGTFLEGSFFIAVALALLEKRARWRIVWWVAVAIVAAGLVFSASRGAWLGVLGAGLLWAALHWKPARYLALAGVALLPGMVLFVLVRGDINALSEIPILGSLAGALFIRPDRLEVYRHSLALLAEQPFTGIGAGGEIFKLVYSRYELLLWVPFLDYSHNLLLEVWLQQGLPGAAAFIWLVAAFFAALPSTPSLKDDLRLQAAGAGLIATLLHGLTDARQYPSLWTWLPFFFLLGLCASRLLAPDPATAAPEQPRRGRFLRGSLLPGALTIIFLVGVLAFTWPPGAAWKANHAALLQIRADFDPSLTPEHQSAMRNESAALFQRALAIDPDSVQINRRYGLLLLEQDRFAEAIPHLELACRAAPDHIAGRKSLGLAYLWNGDLERAAATLGGMPGIIVELQGLAWQEYNDYHYYATAFYTYQLLDQLAPGDEFTLEMLQTLQRRLEENTH